MLRMLGFAVIILALSGPAASAKPEGVLKRIAESGELRIGYVPDAPPMSYRDDGNKVVGYTIDLCRRIATAVQEELGIEKLKLVYLPLELPEERIRAVETGAVDLECGATTITMSRRERVDFTLMTFITGGAVLSKTSAPINSTTGVDGKKIAVIKGTTTEQALKLFARTNDFNVNIDRIDTHEEGIRLLDAGKVDGYASDRTMLIGQAMRSSDGQYSLTRNVFSFEQYGIMLARGDTDLRLVADRALAKLYGTARILRLYHDWFGRHGEPLPPILKAMYEFQAVAE